MDGDGDRGLRPNDKWWCHRCAQVGLKESCDKWKHPSAQEMCNNCAEDKRVRPYKTKNGVKQLKDYACLGHAGDARPASPPRPPKKQRKSNYRPRDQQVTQPPAQQMNFAGPQPNQQFGPVLPFQNMPQYPQQAIQPSVAQAMADFLTAANMLDQSKGRTGSAPPAQQPQTQPAPPQAPPSQELQAMQQELNALRRQMRDQSRQDNRPAQQHRGRLEDGFVRWQREQAERAREASPGPRNDQYRDRSPLRPTPGSVNMPMLGNHQTWRDGNPLTRGNTRGGPQAQGNRGGQQAQDNRGDSHNRGNRGVQHNRGTRGQPNQSTRGGQPNQSTRGGQPGQPNQSTRGGQPNQSTGGRQPNQSTDGGQPNQSTGGGQPNQSTRGGQQNQSTRGSQQNQSTRGRGRGNANRNNGRNGNGKRKRQDGMEIDQTGLTFSQIRHATEDASRQQQPHGAAHLAAPNPQQHGASHLTAPGLDDGQGQQPQQDNATEPMEVSYENGRDANAEDESGQHAGLLAALADVDAVASGVVSAITAQNRATYEQGDTQTPAPVNPEITAQDLAMFDEGNAGESAEAAPELTAQDYAMFNEGNVEEPAEAAPVITAQDLALFNEGNAEEPVEAAPVITAQDLALFDEGNVEEPAEAAPVITAQDLALFNEGNAGVSAPVHPQLDTYHGEFWRQMDAGDFQDEPAKANVSKARSRDDSPLLDFDEDDEVN